MKIKHFRLLTILTLSAGLMGVVGCGKKNDDDDDEVAATSVTTTTTPTANEDETGLAEDDIPESSGEVLGFALNALKSANGESASLRLTDEHESISGCSEHGEPYDSSTGERTLVSEDTFSYQTFKCQLAVDDSVETVLGALTQNKHILCDLERVINDTGVDFEFTAAGATYDVDISITEACGWSAGAVEEVNEMNDGAGISATVTATSFDSGEWEKKLELDGGDAVGLTIYFTANASTVAFKKVDSWDNAERVENGDSLAGMDADDTGITGDFVTISIDEDGIGTLRAELLGTYWGRRTRLFAVGEIDGTTGSFDSITEKAGISANFSPSNGGSGDEVTGLYAEIATVLGSAEEGYAYRSIGYGCSSESDDCDVTSDVTEATVSNSNTYCTTVSGDTESAATCDSDVEIIDFTGAAADFEFLGVAKYFSSQLDTYDDLTSWINSAGTLDFSADDVTAKEAVLE